MWHALGDWVIGSSIDRTLLLRILDYRFGARAGQPPAELPGETETERRLARTLAERLLPRLQNCIRRLAASGLEEPALDTPALLPFAPPGTWEISLVIADGEYHCGELKLQLGASCFEALLQNLSGQRPRGEDSQTHAAFAEQMQIRLSARLLEKQLPLGEILDLKPGAILPVSLQPRAEVCINSSRVFNADVVERHGKLCLAGFVDCD
jgi:flagellar motor switch protein FliM